MKKSFIIWIWMCGITLFLITGCNTAPKSEPSADSALIQPTNEPDGQDLTTAPITDSQGVDGQLAAAFTTVENYPVQEDIGAELWLAAQAVIQDAALGIDSSTTEQSAQSTSPLNDYVTQYKNIVSDKGFHYTEESVYFGMNITSEYWVKKGQFKKIEGDKVIVYDGKTCIEYSLTDKSGTSLDPASLPSELMQLLDSKLLPFTSVPLVQQDPQAINGIDCEVFFMEMEVMDMKGLTLYVHKDTGLVIKQLIGDESNGLVTTITQYEIGGFDDQVFEIPTDIQVN